MLHNYCAETARFHEIAIETYIENANSITFVFHGVSYTSNDTFQIKSQESLK